MKFLLVMSLMLFATVSIDDARAQRLTNEQKFQLALQMDDDSEIFVDPLFEHVRVMTVNELEQVENLVNRIHDVDKIFRIGVSFYLGGVEDEGQPGLRSVKKANSWLRRGSDLGHGKSIMGLAIIARDQGNSARYVKYLLKATRLETNPVPDAFFGLGIVYDQGIGRFPNKKRALEYYKKAAALGVEEAYMKLADWNIKGFVTGEQDFDKAIEYYMLVEKTTKNKKIARNMALKIAEIYGWLASVRPGYDEKAFTWLLKAAEAKNVASYIRVGHAYKEGIGVEKDTTVALKWYTEAAKHNEVRAMELLAYTYANGLHGVEEDYCRAKDWYQKAAEAESADAAWNLGFFYTQGFCVAKDMELARKWFNRSRNLGKSANGR